MFLFIVHIFAQPPLLDFQRKIFELSKYDGFQGLALRTNFTENDSFSVCNIDIRN